MRKLELGKIVCIVAVLCLAVSVASSAQTLTTLLNFDGTDGSAPSALTLAFNGNYYGVTTYGGTSSYCPGKNGCGTIFEMSPEGKVRTLYNFCSQPGCADGLFPMAALLQANDGNLYGTTAGAGEPGYCEKEGGCGTVFEITPSGKLTTFYSFCSQANCADGTQPETPLVPGAQGVFYGTTFQGGSNGGGTVFEITRSRKLTTLHTFCPQTNCSDGANPTGLLKASNLSLYGTTGFGGILGAGAIFEITRAGTFSTIFSFPMDDQSAQSPNALIQGGDGNFYGTTQGGGTTQSGSFFRLTPKGKLTVLYSFCSQTGCPDGAVPTTALVPGSDSNFCGTTSEGGANGQGGTIFEITPSGTLTTLYSFCAEVNDNLCVDGSGPRGLVPATNGTFYGETTAGGSIGDGTVFTIQVTE
jgi:uncharacterized repeat protein (TIGR03803 family)